MLGVPSRGSAGSDRGVAAAAPAVNGTISPNGASGCIVVECQSVRDAGWTIAAFSTCTFATTGSFT